jgi:hypothetical protein
MRHRRAAPDRPAYAIQSNRVAEKTQLTSGLLFFYCPDRKGHNLTYQVKIFPWTAIFLLESSVPGTFSRPMDCANSKVAINPANCPNGQFLSLALHNATHRLFA